MTKLLSRIALATSVLAASVMGGVLVPAGAAYAAHAAGTPYIAVPPVRLLDTRKTAIAAADSVTELKVTEANGVPEDAAAVWVNITAVLPTADGHITVFPCGEDQPHTANVNYTTGSVSPNAVLAKVGENGQICMWTLASTHIVVDLNGYVGHDGTPTPIVPIRAGDTRTATPAAKPVAGSVTEFQITGLEGVPAGATAAMLNVVAVLPDGPGHLTVYPCDVDRDNTANVNYTTGSTSPNAVLSGLSADGKVCIWTYAASHIVVDVMGFVPVGGTPVPVAPARLEDTRKSTTNPKPAAGSVTKVKVAGEAGVPDDASAAMLNVVAVLPDGPGHLTVYPCDAERTNTANVNYTTGSTSPNAVMSGLSADGDVCIWTYAATHIVVDVMAYVPALPPATTCTIADVAVATSIPQTECDALVAFYTDLDGPNWIGDKTGWNTAVDPCTWKDVTCSDGHVTAIDRQYRGLAGDMPAEIGDLVGLTVLSLQGNEITSLPPEISSLTALEDLDLGINALTVLPPEIGDLEALIFLRVAANELTVLPPEIGTLSALEELNAAGNALTVVPPEVEDLAALKVLWLGANPITVLPPEIGNLSALELLEVSGADLTDVPTEIGDLKELRQLDLSDNAITALPAEVGNLSKLEVLLLNTNAISGDITPVFMPLMQDAAAMSEIALSGNGCMTVTNLTLATWLDSFDPDWEDGCP